MRDLRVRREAGGLDTSAEEKKAWATQLRRVLLKDTAGSHEEAGQVAKATRPEKVFRLRSLDLLAALDGQLRATAGFGLGAFRLAPSEEAVPYASNRVRVPLHRRGVQQHSPCVLDAVAGEAEGVLRFYL